MYETNTKYDYAIIPKGELLNHTQNFSQNGSRDLLSKALSRTCRTEVFSHKSYRGQLKSTKFSNRKLKHRPACFIEFTTERTNGLSIRNIFTPYVQ